MKTAYYDNEGIISHYEGRDERRGSRFKGKLLRRTRRGLPPQSLEQPRVQGKSYSKGGRIVRGWKREGL